MKVLFDTNVIVDVLLDREPFSAEAGELLSCVERGEVTGFVAATTVTTVYYLCAKGGGRSEAKKQVTTLLSMLDVTPVNRSVLDAALSSQVSDFEDAVLAEAGKAVPVDSIATRNKKDFARCGVPVYTPAEVIQILASEKRAREE